MAEGSAGVLSVPSQLGTPVSFATGGGDVSLMPLSQSGTAEGSTSAGASVVRSLSQDGVSPEGGALSLGAWLASAIQARSCSPPLGGVASRWVSRSQSGRLPSGVGETGGDVGGSCAGASVPARSLNHDGSCSEGTPAEGGAGVDWVSRSQSGRPAESLACVGVGLSIQLGASAADAV